jgi:hypothetical protein
MRLNSLADRFVISQRPARRGGRQELQQLDARNPPWREEKKKKNKSRKAAKPQRQSASAESHIERTTISLRLCAFARVKKRLERAKPPSRKEGGTISLRLCAFARRKEKIRRGGSLREEIPLTPLSRGSCPNCVLPAAVGLGEEKKRARSWF